MAERPAEAKIFKICAALSSLVERPAEFLKYGQLVHRLERFPDKKEVRGSIPRLPTTIKTWFIDRLVVDC